MLKGSNLEAGPRDRSARSRKSAKSGKSNGAHSHKSGTKRKKNRARGGGTRNSEVKIAPKGRSLLLGDNGIEIDSLEQDNSFEKERTEQESSKVPISIEKYAVIENMKSVVCKGEIKDGDSNRRIQK